MKTICNNKWISLFVTQSFREFEERMAKQKNDKIITLNQDKNGIYYYCIDVKNSLTQENIFSITFSTDYEENNISFLIWDQLFIVSTGAGLYFVNSIDIKMEASFELFSSLMGLYVTKGNHLLVLEELSCRILSSKGDVLGDYQFNDIVEDFNLKEDVLFIKINSDVIAIKLI